LKNKNLLFYLFAGYIIYWLYGKKQLGDKTKLSFKNIRITGSGISKRIEIIFKVINPTNTTGTINAISGEVFVNGKYVADFASFGVQTIRPKSESDLSVFAKPNIGLLSLITEKGAFAKGAKYTIKGTTNIDGLIIPFEYSSKLF
jgi:LEA14-like dessication related protein